MASDDLRRRIPELEEKVTRLSLENAELRAELRRATEPSPAEQALASRLADPEWVEIYRQDAWTRGQITKYWSDEAKDFVVPEGWPDGIDPEDFIAEQVGVEKVYRHRVEARSSADDRASTTFLHQMLRRG